MSEHDLSDYQVYEAAIESLRAQIANAGAHVVMDSKARNRYARLIKEMADDFDQQVRLGSMTWADAAEQAHEARNIIMGTLRGQATPIGRAMAQKIKRDGKTFNELIARKTLSIYGPRAIFHQLTTIQKNLVYADIVRSAGRSNSEVNWFLRKASPAGRGLVFLSIAISITMIALSDNRAATAKREGALTAAGVGGGLAGGALAGLACGPAAPLCVTAGAFVGGAMAAFGVSFAF